MTIKRKHVLWLMVLLLCVYWLGTMFPANSSDSVLLADGKPSTPLQPGEQHTINLFKKASPSVVYINTLAKQINLWTRRVSEVPQGTGSGFIWDDQGHIVTNYHVIARASRAEVVLYDHETYEAKLVGASADHDLAVLKIDAPREKLKALTVGRSSNLQVGQSVYAIGNPFGLDHSLSTGVISSLGRNITSVSGRTIEDVIQTDAAINPGNSGGPLLNSGGQLIGVNTAIASPSGANSGVGFAVPVDTVLRIVPELIEHGKYLRPALGISTDDRVSQWIARQSGVKGLAILYVYPDTGAAKVGLKPAKQTANGKIIPGDIITRIEDRQVDSVSDLFNALEKYADKDSVKVEIWREGKTTKYDITLTYPDPDE